MVRRFGTLVSAPIFYADRLGAGEVGVLN
jgi:hypothetical protein